MSQLPSCFFSNWTRSLSQYAMNSFSSIGFTTIGDAVVTPPDAGPPDDDDDWAVGVVNTLPLGDADGAATATTTVWPATPRTGVAAAVEVAEPVVDATCWDFVSLPPLLLVNGSCGVAVAAVDGVGVGGEGVAI
jgi:hypothetical protein